VSACEQEVKYTLGNGRAGAALALLRVRCRPDPEHPRGVVSSLYYDAQDFRALYEKGNSDYLKMKVRLRWYGVEGPDPSQAFIEAKYRVGGRRDKVRVSTRYSSEWLERTPLDDPELAAIPWLLRSHGVTLTADWQPMFVVRYERYRFIEPLTGARVSLDANVSVPAVNLRRLRSARPSMLPTAVVEVKGMDMELPATLTGLLYLGCRKSSFSKYAACYHWLVQAMS
jgi:hypothetical protein